MLYNKLMKRERGRDREGRRVGGIGWVPFSLQEAGAWSLNSLSTL